jgi:hypothetical protein
MDLSVIEMKWILFHEPTFNMKLWMYWKEVQISTADRRGVISVRDAHA